MKVVCGSTVYAAFTP
nr:hypothetical protein [Vibrio sp. 03_296]